MPPAEQTIDENLLELTAASRAKRLEWLLQGVLEVQSLITEADFNLDAFMQRIVDVAETLTDAKGAVVELVDGEDMIYRCTSKSISEHVGLRLKRSSSLSGLCVTGAQVLRCDDSEHDPRVDQEACRRVGVRSMICTPLFQTGQAVGVLKVMGGEPNAFDSNDQYLLSLLAGALGAALGKQLALEALKTSEETFRSAMETTSIGMALVKPNGHFLKVNAAMCDLLGYSEAELLANDTSSITHQDDRERDQELLERTLRGEISRFRVEKRYYHKSGRTIWVLVSIALVRDSRGNPGYFVGHVQDLTEQREMDRMKSEFISMVSHELRTPLTSIKGSLGLILGAMAEGLPDRTRGLLDIAHNNAERLVLLINDLLDIEKIASGNMRFDMRARALAAITSKAVQANEAYAEKFKARIQLAAIDPELEVWIDEDRYIQVLSNLLSNAAKFSPAGGTIEVSCEARAQRIRICVRDQGPGIPVEFRSRIFGRFCQADSSAARKVGGTGLGLHIARQLVEHMRGTIGFDTEIGRGTTFWIEFPVHPHS
jgi:PAS domain S-box-containing protein